MAVALTGCTASPVPSPTASAAVPLPAGVSVELVQYRTDYGPRRIQLKVVNDSDAPVRVTALTLRSPLFADAVSTDRAQTIPPGTARDLPVDLAAGVCEPSTQTGAVVEIELTDAEGRAAAGTVTPTDPLGWLGRIHADDCLTAGFEDAVEVAVGPVTVDRSGERPVAHLQLTAISAGASTRATTVAQVARTILLRPATGGATGWSLGWSLDAAHPTATADLAIVPNNCNPHTLAEDKRGTFWPLEVTLADGTGGVVYAASDDVVRGDLYRFVAEYCGF